MKQIKQKRTIKTVQTHVIDESDLARDGPRNFLEDCAGNPRWSTLSGARALNDTRVRGGRD